VLLSLADFAPVVACVLFAAAFLPIPEHPKGVMMFKRRIWLATVAAVLALPAVALAQTLPLPQQTVQATSGPEHCSVTAAGPHFGVATGHTTLDYGGGTSCAGAPIEWKQLTVWVQVHNLTLNRWFNVSGTELASSGWGNLQAVSAFNDTPGHAYRITAHAFLEEPNGYAGCSLKGPWGCYQPVNVSATTMVAVAP